MSVNFYTFSYQNPKREQAMRQRFHEENLTLEFVEPVVGTDARLISASPQVKRNWAIMFNHLDMLKQFLESDAEYGIFCEDDIFIRRNIASYLPEITNQFARRKLDILLLGYLLPFKAVEIKPASRDFAEHGINFTYTRYPEDLWGSQMYMLNRQSARRLHDKYGVDYAVATLTNTRLTPFSPDWILTKDGERAILYPMLAVEEGIVVTDHPGQVDFHKQCFRAQFDALQFH
jgi:hypothetical protein